MTVDLVLQIFEKKSHLCFVEKSEGRAKEFTIGRFSNTKIEQNFASLFDSRLLVGLRVNKSIVLFIIIVKKELNDGNELDFRDVVNVEQTVAQHIQALLFEDERDEFGDLARVDVVRFDEGLDGFPEV